MKIFHEIEGISENQFVNKHWGERLKIHNVHIMQLKGLLRPFALMTFFKPVKIKFGWKNNNDLDNNSITQKHIIDMLRDKRYKIILDDNKNYVKKIECQIDKKNWFEIKEIFTGRTLKEKIQHRIRILSVEPITFEGKFCIKELNLILDEIDKIEEFEELK